MIQSDCAFSDARGWFRYRAGAIILEDDCVLMIKNITDPYYYSVGGAVKLGESAREAAVREAFEETGVQYEIDRLQFIHENFFPGKDAVMGEAILCHEVALYFLMKPRGIKVFQPATPELGVPLEQAVWLPVATYKDHAAYPAFFGEKLQDLKDCVEHILTRE